MEIELIIRKMKDIYSCLMEFIDSTENIEHLINIFMRNEILKNKEEMISILKLLSIIADKHHRLPDFINKLEKIFEYLFKEIRSYLSDFQIYKVYKNNKRILLLLFEGGFIQPDENALSEIMVKLDYNNYPYRHYLYSGLKLFVEKNELETIEKEIKEKYDEEISNFEEKCRIGENDSYLCSLIRQDSVEEFISYVNRANISLSSIIQPSIFETNSFLIHSETSIIEYATFFGSYQIVQYLRYSQVKLTTSLWIYSVHSNNAELIHFLEDNEVEQVKYIDIVNESIQCHHNQIADYFKDNFLEDQKEIDDIELNVINSYNYYYFPTDIGHIISSQWKKYGFNISRLSFQLKNITIPSSVTLIEDNIFTDCLSFTKIIIPSSVKFIGDYAFSGCSSLTEITIPSSVTSIAKYAFEKCYSLKKISIPSSVLSIGNHSLSECSSLTQILIPSSVNFIYDFAFNECSSLTEITIPSSVKSIGEGLFADCSSLKQVSILLSITSIKKSLFEGCSSLTQFTIPPSVTLIEENAFRYCSSLTEIIIPSSVTSIEENAFRDCSSLTKIIIPSSVTLIEKNAFRDCSSLIEISIPSSIVSIKDNVFSGCKSLKHVSIPSSVTLIGNSSFYECSSLEQMSIPSSVTAIGCCAFFGCSKMTRISIPSSVSSIGSDSFHGCFSLTNINLPLSIDASDLSIPSNVQVTYGSNCQIY